VVTPRNDATNTTAEAITSADGLERLLVELFSSELPGALSPIAATTRDRPLTVVGSIPCDARCYVSLENKTTSLTVSIRI